MGAKMEPTWSQNGAKMLSEDGVGEGFSFGCVLGSILGPIFIDFRTVLECFFDASLDRRILWMKSANVQNHSIFTIDFEDFTEATKYEKH